MQGCITAIFFARTGFHVPTAAATGPGQVANLTYVIAANPLPKKSTGRRLVLVELVRTTTPDGCTLDGALNRPAAGAIKNLNIDGIALIHGTGGNFYNSTFFELLATKLAE